MSDVTQPPSNRRSVWNKSRINFWLDIALAIVFIAVATVTALLRFAFPLPTSADGWKLWNYTYDDLSHLQFNLTCGLGAGIVLHVMLHWSWICGMLTRGNTSSTLKTDNGTQTLLGVLVLAVALHAIGLTVLFGILSVVKP